MLRNKAYSVFLIISGLCYLFVTNVIAGFIAIAFVLVYFLKVNKQDKKLVFSLLALLTVSLISKHTYYSTLENKVNAPVTLKGLVLSQNSEEHYLNAKVLVFNLNDYNGENLTRLKVFTIFLPKNNSQLKGKYIVASGIVKEKTVYKNPVTNRENSLKSRNLAYYIKIPSFNNLTLKSTFLSIVYKQIDSINLNNEINTAVFKAITTGDKNSIPFELRKILQNSGFYHLFVVSGLHFSIFFSFIYLLLMLVPIRKKHKTAIALSVLPLLLVLNGFSPSTIRAFSMLFIYFLFSAFDIEVKPKDAVGIAGLLMVLFNPYNSADPGFILSFLITGAIVSSFNKETGTVLNLIKISFIAFVTATPVLLVFFHKVNPAAPLLNIIATPVLSFSIYSFLFALINFPFAKTIVNFLVSFLINLAKLGSNCSFEIFLPSSFTFLYLTTTAIYSSLKINLKNTFVFSALIIVPFLFYLATPFKQNLLIIADTGQSQAVVFKAENKNIIIDCSTEHCAKTVLTPILKSKKINKIDYLFVTHFDNDHAGGLLEILKNFKVKNLYFPYKDNNSQNFCKTYSYAKQHNINLFFPNAKKDLTVGKANIQMLNTNNKLNNGSSNAKSLVLFVKIKNNKILIPGDLDGKPLKRLCKNLPQTDILIAPHHGSKKAAIPCLCQKTKPKLVIVCAGKYNRFNFPSKQFTNLFKNSAIVITGKNGYIEISLK
jgi:competence protein ComEC